MAGPVARRYKSGSIVFFEGDIDDKIFILRSGRVVLLSTALDSRREIREELAVGEFFGVKSSLGRFPREETAQTIGDTTLLVFELEDFVALMRKNFRLVLQMLKVFSNQLRNIGKNVRETLGDKSLRLPATELLKLAEYYYEGNKLSYAKHAYSRYLTGYPSGKYKVRAQQMLKSIEQGALFPGRYEPLYVSESEAEKQDIPQGAAFATVNEVIPSSKTNIVQSQGIIPQVGKQEQGGDFSLESDEIDFSM